jgi:Sulfotransferase domain
MDRYRDGGRLPDRDGAARVGPLLNLPPGPSIERPGGTTTLAPAGPVSVVFVVGSGRSGSTLLDILLGQVDGFFSTGELHSLWWAGILEGRRCGCGLAVTECPVWRDVITRTARDGPVRSHARQVARLQAGLPGPVGAWALAGGREVGRDLDRYGELLGETYRTIAETTGARVVVDSTKHPAVAALLPRLRGIRPYFVHLVRDPRGVAHSWSRRKPATDRYGTLEMERFYAGASAGRWLLEQAAAGALCRAHPGSSLGLRYEDLARDPAAAVGKILSLVGEEPERAAFLARPQLHLRTTHTVSGNPVRLHSGPLRIALDDEWRSAMPRVRRWLVTALTSPFLLRYGYLSRAAVRTPEGRPAGSSAGSS